MIDLTRNEAHVLLAGIRVLAHLNSRSPTPEELAEMLQASASAVRLQLAHLEDMGAVALVKSAFETHVEIRNHLLVDELKEESGPAITDDLADFDRRKQEEAEKMAHLFDSGEHEQNQKQKLDRMDQELDDFRRRKPPNPFADD